MLSAGKPAEGTSWPPRSALGWGAQRDGRPGGPHLQDAGMASAVWDPTATPREGAALARWVEGENAAPPARGWAACCVCLSACA